MKGKWLGFPLIFLLLSAATFSFTNESVIEDWLKSNSIVVQSDEIDTLPIQNDEYWPVLIVDFNGRNTNSNTAISEAESMLIPNANEYFLELSRGSVTVNIDIHTVMTTASGNLADYGSDYGVERDSSSDGTHLPMQLAEEVVLANKESFSWDKYDLNNDGIVDRLLILHTTIGQETGGNSNRIWSHFTTFEDYIELGEGLSIGHYAVASLGSGLEGFGTAMHEMLHQMGAYDLYPSDGQQTSVWKGVGDWDIMASGNWNDDGKTPALPMSSTLETIGLDNYENVVFNWVQEADYCTANSIIFSSFDQNKLDYKIPISEGEYVWIEYREGNSYDDELPGNGVLVSYQDTTVSGYDDNELNVNNKRPYLKIIEADGNDELLSGSNEGQASDIFMNGTKFGSEGIEIRNHDGVLVDWYAEVIIQNQVEILFKSDSCVAEFSVDLPNYSITSLLNQPISFSAKSAVTCALDNQLTSTDGRLVSISANQLIAGETTHLEIRFNSAAQHNSKTRLVGTLECGTEIVDLDIEVLSLSILPKNSSFSETIPVNSNSEVSIPIDTTGSGSHNFEYKIDGPLSRIADSQQILRLTGENDYLIIDIDPKELLTNNMIVNGVIEITDSNGNQWDIDVVLTAESSVTKSINDYISPSQMVGLACIFAALWIFLTMKDSAKDEIEELPKQYSVTETSFEQTPVDAWGRPIDD